MCKKVFIAVLKGHTQRQGVKLKDNSAHFWRVSLWWHLWCRTRLYTRKLTKVVVGRIKSYATVCLITHLANCCVTKQLALCLKHTDSFTMIYCILRVKLHGSCNFEFKKKNNYCLTSLKSQMVKILIANSVVDSHLSWNTDSKVTKTDERNPRREIAMIYRS